MQDAALAGWEWAETVTVEPVEGGLINHTWWVVGGRGPFAVLQRLNTRIFRAVVHEDIEAVTSRLAERGVVTPRLVRTRAGALWHEVNGDVYRCLTLVGDRTLTQVDDPADARSAARLLGRWHAAVRDLDWEFRMVRPAVHDTARHFGKLREVLGSHREHRLYDEVASLAEDILGGWSPAAVVPTPVRVVHGDPKLANVRFSGREAVALVDLDTTQRSTLPVELGDAMRSWCNLAPESAAAGRFDVALFEAAMVGYAEGSGPGAVNEEEWASIVPGVEQVAWELASRFAMDALAEQYFGWDPQYGGRGEHNLLRARGQAALARSVREQRGAAESALGRARLVRP